MKLSPLELRKHQFVKRFRLSGYDPDEVNGFVRQMADQWSDLLEENRRFEERTRELESKLSHYEQVELALQEALETARHTARQLEDNAQRKAELTVEEAELRAQRMLQDAEQERYSIKQDLVKLSSRQTEIAARMRAFLMAEMEVLAQFQGDDPSGFLRLISANEVGPPAMLEASDARHEHAAAEEPAMEEAVLEEPELEEDSGSEAWQNETIIETELEAVEVEEEPPSPVAEVPDSEPEMEEVLPPPIPPPITLDVEDTVAEVPAETKDEPEFSPVISVAGLPSVDEVPVVSAESETAPEPPFPDPAWPPVEEADVLPPAPDPVVLESVEELIAQTQIPPPVPHLGQEDSASPPTYRDVLSDTQAADEPVENRSPFSSSFFESPLSDSSEAEQAEAPEPVPGSDSAQDWSLRSLVTGDGDAEPTPSSASEAERDRIRRILEDLD